MNLRARAVRNSAGTTDIQNCHLRYVGHTDFKIDKEKKAMVRTYIDCLTSSNLNEYLQALGFKYGHLAHFFFIFFKSIFFQVYFFHVFFDSSLDAELIMKGFLFHKGILKVVVSKAFSQVSPEHFQPITQSNFVEISCVVSVGQVTLFFLYL